MSFFSEIIRISIDALLSCDGMLSCDAVGDFEVRWAFGISDMLSSGAKVMLRSAMQCTAGRPGACEPPACSCVEHCGSASLTNHI